MSTTSRPLSTVPSSEEPTPRSEPHSVRAQSAIVRTLTDALAHHAGSADVEDGIRQQLDEEQDRLDSRLLEAAAVR